MRGAGSHTLRRSLSTVFPVQPHSRARPKSTGTPTVPCVRRRASPRPCQDYSIYILSETLREPGATWTLHCDDVFFCRVKNPCSLFGRTIVQNAFQALLRFLLIRLAPDSARGKQCGLLPIEISDQERALISVCIEFESVGDNARRFPM